MCSCSYVSTMKNDSFHCGCQWIGLTSAQFFDACNFLRCHSHIHSESTEHDGFRFIDYWWLRICRFLFLCSVNHRVTYWWIYRLIRCTKCVCAGVCAKCLKMKLKLWWWEMQNLTLSSELAMIFNAFITSELLILYHLVVVWLFIIRLKFGGKVLAFGLSHSV